jgi:hypothetical protein
MEYDHQNTQLYDLKCNKTEVKRANKMASSQNGTGLG